MDHRFQLHDTSGRSRYGGGFARRAIARGRGHVQGSSQSRNKMSSSMIALDSISSNDSPSEGISVAFESMRNSSNKANGTPMKTLIHEEMSREKKVSQSSPSVIAKLMGLDSLPPPQLVTKQRETGRCLQKTNNTYYRDQSFGMSTREHQEFKDVFEIKDSRKVEKHKNQPFSEGRLHTKQDDMEVAFIRKKFMEAKRLSTDEKFQNSKEFSDALEVLDSNRDIFLKFLEEPNSFSTRHLQDPEAFPPAQHESHITVLKSSRDKTYEIDDVPNKLQLKTERRGQMQKDPRSFLRKPTTNLFNHLLQEHGGSVTHKLSKAAYAGKTSNKHLSTRIVVLKPNLAKLQDNTRNISLPSSHENRPLGYRRHREFQQSGIQELHIEDRQRHNLFDNVEVLGQGTKGSREIAKEIAIQMNHSVNCSSDKKLVSRFSRHIKDETSCAFNGIHRSNHSEDQQIPDKVEYWNSNLSPSNSSTESSVSKESRKRLSERWRMANQIQQARLSGGGLSTLGEMLGQLDNEVPRERILAEKLARGMHETHFYPSGISSKDGWKDECTKILPRYSSPTKSSAHVTPKSSKQQVSEGGSCYMLKDVLNLGVVDSSGQSLNQSRRSSRKSFKSRSYNAHLSPGEEENMLPVREIHMNMNQEELKNNDHVSDRSEVNLSNIANSSNSLDSSSATDSMFVEMPLIASEKLVQQPAQEESSCINQIDEVIKERSPSHPQMDPIAYECGEKGSEFLVSSSSGEKPSPVSVLEHPLEEGESSPECFQKVSADLQELRKQLRLLRLESSTYNTECEAPAMSGDDIEPCNAPLYRNEVDRDRSYLLEALGHVDLDSHSSPKQALDSDVFEKLEERYGSIVEWSRSERKLYFDLISSIVEEILSPNRGLVSRVFGDEEFVEEAWQIMLRQRRETSRGSSEKNILDPRWLDLGDDLRVIGGDIGRMLMDDLLDEFVFDFITDEWF